MKFLALALSFALVSLAKSQQYCGFNGPKDGPTLQGANFISNFGTDECLTLGDEAVNYRLPISLGSCQWNNPRPNPNQLFTVQNSGSGSVLSPAQSKAASFCFDTDQNTLASAQCSPKSDEQTWVIQRNQVPGGKPSQEYQIIQSSSGRCLTVNSGFGANNAILQNCNQGDNLQLWRICTSQGQGQGQGNVGASGPVLSSILDPKGNER